MKHAAEERTRWLLVVTYAIAMAWLEAACVYYIRVLVDRVEPYQANPLPIRGILGRVELVREAATLVMLLVTGMLAGRTWPTRLGYAAVAFGVWDVLYYVFLSIFSDWPTSLLDWDILFLLPLPWWGPVLAPVCIACLMIVWGTCATQFPNRDSSPAGTRIVWSSSGVGIALALYVFMAGSLASIRQGLDVTQQLPTSFNWPLFWVAFTLMSAPIAQRAWRWRSGRRVLSRKETSAASLGCSGRLGGLPDGR